MPVQPLSMQELTRISFFSAVKSHETRLGLHGENGSTVNPGLHQNANANDTCGGQARPMYSTFVHCLAFAEAANRPHECIVCEFPLMYRQSTDSIRLFAEHSSHNQMLLASPR